MVKSAKNRKQDSKKAGSRKARTKKLARNHDYEASPEELLAFYRQMLLIRRFEEKAGQMYGLGLIGGFCHLYIGQEAVVVGVEAAIEPDDSVITGYRDHGHMIARGIDPKAVMAELTGRSGGISKGKGGSMHMFSVDHAFYGGHGIVAAQASIGTGLAFAHQYSKTKKISVTYFGDGAANQGQVFESFNMAKLWNLPVLYVIENNLYAMGTSLHRATGSSELYKRGASFNIPGKQVDGMNVLAVKAAVDDAVKFIRAGKGPMILEMKTYRYRGHSMSDPAKYRTKEEVQKMKAERDPINFIKERILAEGLLDEAGLKAIDKDLRAEVMAAADFAQASPVPDADKLFKNILAEG